MNQLALTLPLNNYPTRQIALEPRYDNGGPAPICAVVIELRSDAEMAAMHAWALSMGHRVTNAPDTATHNRIRIAALDTARDAAGYGGNGLDIGDEMPRAPIRILIGASVVTLVFVAMTVMGWLR